ncbi:hypothetical protein [Streptococcus pseudopneumoniae]|uniref:hypothetical protein n=1 Tax=Streptococcus pseudopneumoniae TaxID=257758 RepID=UPI00066C5AA2|nr:hypothetical protein [Streptococcus pseudopneumoniae]
MRNVKNKNIHGNVSNVDNSTNIKQTTNIFHTNVMTKVNTGSSTSDNSEIMWIIISLFVISLFILFIDPVRNFLNNNIIFIWTYLVIASIAPLFYIFYKSGEYRLKNAIIALVQTTIVISANIINQNIKFPEQLIDYLNQFSNGKLDNLVNVLISYFQNGNSKFFLYLLLYIVCYVMSILSPLVVGYNTFKFKKIPNVIPWIALVISILFSYFGIKILQ